MSSFSDNINSLYTDYEPAYKNDYIVNFITDSDTENMNDYFSAHAISVKFGEEKLDLHRNSVSKFFQVNTKDTYKRSDILTITLREDSSWKVKKYHEAWLEKFYNRKSDIYISRDERFDPTIFRTIKVFLGDKDSTSNIIEFDGVIPQVAPGLDLKWGSNPEIVTYTISYYVKDWKWV